MSKWGIRIHRAAGDPWQRGKQFRVDPKRHGHWIEWRDEWPNRIAAMLRLAQYRKNGWSGHVFKIVQPVKPVEYPTATHYSPNFTRAELDCHSGEKTPQSVQKQLVITATNLELLRHELGGGPLSVVSGYRSPAYNKVVHGASNSQHIYGTAADLGVPSGQQRRYVAAAERVPAFNKGGIGVYPSGAVHVDHRGHKARWTSWTRT